MTKKIIFFSVVLMLVGFLISGYIFFATKSKVFIADFIKKNLTENVSFGYIGIEYPLRIVLRDVKIFQKEVLQDQVLTLALPKPRPGLEVSIDRVYIYPHPVLSFKNRILVSKVDIIHPVIAVTRGTDGSFNVPIPNGMLKAQQARNIFISRVDLEDGILKYSDKKLGDGFSLIFENIDARFDNISFPFALGTSKIRLFANIKNNNTKPASLSLNGYIRINDKSLKAKLSLEDLDIHSLEPLYNRYLAGLIKEGILNFYSRIESEGQTLKAGCRLNVERANLIKDIKVSPEENLSVEFLLSLNLKDFIIKISNVRGNLFEILFDKILAAQKNNTTSQITN